MDDGTIFRMVSCYENQIARLQARLAVVSEERDEIQLRREETVAMCEQLKLENDRLRKRIADGPVAEVMQVGNFTIWDRSINPERDDELRRFGYEKVKVRLVEVEDGDQG